MTDKSALIQPDRGQQATPIHLVNKAGLDAFLATLTAAQRGALAAQRFEGGGYETAILPAAGPASDGWSAVGGVADPAALSSWCLAKLAETLPAGTYRLAEGDPGKALHGWQTAQYRFGRYKAKGDEPEPGPRVLLTKEAKAIPLARAEAAAVALVRDLVNTPAEDMGPGELATAAEKLAKQHGAAIRVTHGDALEQGYPLVHAVGRAAVRARAPRLIELEWGDPAQPRLAVVGKGVCFDSGGLDIKPSSGMLLMKKDMGGAAHALALAGLIMEAGMPVRLHCLVPAVENVIAGNAMRPGDVFRARGAAGKPGLSVEITNTDAEGRLILADALVRACEEKPALLINFATLTGAARVALGPDLPALFARQDATAEALLAAGIATDDAVWRLPMPDAYREWLKSDVADLQNSPANGFAGASVAALFLDRFVAEGVDWAHFDTFAWRPVARPGRPRGGEALGLRAAFAMVKGRFAA